MNVKFGRSPWVKNTKENIWEGDSEGMEVTGGGENCIMGVFMIFPSNKMLLWPTQVE
jgi:hypothetical protein